MQRYYAETCLRPNAEHSVFGVPQPRRPGSRTMPLEVARLAAGTEYREPQLTPAWDAKRYV